MEVLAEQKGPDLARLPDEQFNTEELLILGADEHLSEGGRQTQSEQRIPKQPTTKSMLPQEELLNSFARNLSSTSQHTMLS